MVVMYAIQLVYDSLTNIIEASLHLCECPPSWPPPHGPHLMPPQQITISQLYDDIFPTLSIGNDCRDPLKLVQHHHKYTVVLIAP